MPVGPVAPLFALQFTAASQLAQLPVGLAVSITLKAPVGFPCARLVL
jgi:hypothetical protein